MTSPVAGSGISLESYYQLQMTLTVHVECLTICCVDVFAIEDTVLDEQRGVIESELK